MPSVVESYREQAEREMRSAAAGERSAESAPPTRRQVYALAAVLLERAGEEWPPTDHDARALIRRLST
jgi:hypothetical protein